MAMDDYFYDCQKVEKRTVNDGLGGYEKVLYRGVTFKGLVVRKSSTEQLIGSLRGLQVDQVNFFTYSSFPLDKDDIIAYTEKEGGEEKFIRISSDEVVNTELSQQTDWVGRDAETYNVDASTILPT